VSRNRGTGLLLRFFLWWAVLGMSLWVGGTVFNMLVIVPLWSASPPESVRAFFRGTDFNRTVWNFFGPPWMVVRSAPLLTALVLAWRRPAHRTWLAAAFTCTLFGVVYTLVYVYPINAVLMTQAGGRRRRGRDSRDGPPPDLRGSPALRGGLIGFLALLRAFRLPVSSARAA
jgi:hypothetical protein